MRFGICAGMDKIFEVQEMGFDYLEAGLSSLAALPEEEFAAVKEQAAGASIRVECCNLLFPGEILLTNGQSDWKKIRAYLDKAFSRLRQLDGELAVFGSGRSRSYPEGISFAEGYRFLTEAARQIGRAAADWGVTVAIEPLNSGESNLINTITEGAMLMAGTDNPSVGLLADSYHLFKEGEPMEHIRRVGGLAHTHVALLEGRAYPVRPEAELREFFQALHQIGYTGRMSIEGNTSCFEQDAPAALRVLRELDAMDSKER